MTMQLIGAGLGRTGTMSLKLALERLLGGTCHHMKEVGAHPEEVPFWHAAIRGETVDYRTVLDGYTAIVDYPGAAVWHQLADAFPEAPVLLSTRASAEQWWQSASATILVRRDPVDDAARERWSMVTDMFAVSLGDIVLTRLQELVTDLYLAETEAKTKKLWQQVEKALNKIKLKPTIKSRILEKQDVKILAQNLQEWLR